MWAGTYLNDGVGEPRGSRIGSSDIAILYRRPKSPTLERGLFQDAEDLSLGVKELVDDSLCTAIVKLSTSDDGCSHRKLTLGREIPSMVCIGNRHACHVPDVPVNAEQMRVSIHEA